MKPHKHAELIHAWADGAEIEWKHHSGEWLPLECAVWVEALEYRIKPREFEEGAFYPVLLEDETNDVAWYRCGFFYMTAIAEPHDQEEFQWIGEKLEIEWPE